MYFTWLNAKTTGMKNKKNLLLVAVGGITGFVNGFFGGGGGMIVVPMLTLLVKLEEKKAHATAIAVILPITLVSVVIYLFNGAARLNLAQTIFTAIGVTVGGVIGALLLKKLNNATLVKAFAVVMLAAGVKLLFF